MTQRDPWAELEKIAREIDPELPQDLRGYEIRIILSPLYRSIELIMRGQVHGEATMGGKE